MELILSWILELFFTPAKISEMAFERAEIFSYFGQLTYEQVLNPASKQKSYSYLIIYINY